MEVTWPEDRCDLSPNHAHHFLVISGSIWRCKYCWRCKWLPTYLSEAVKFTADISKLKINLAYQKSIHYKPEIRRTLRKLEEIRLLRKVGLPNGMLMRAIAAIVIDKERDKERVSKSENF